MRRMAAVLLLLIASAPAMAESIPNLTPAERADLKRIETYLNELGTIKSRFVQANPDGSHSEGTMYLQRPGRLRFEYDPPDPYLIITYGKWFIYVDKELEEATYVPVERTPAYFIVKEDIRFGGSLSVSSFRRGNSVFRVEVEQADQPDAGRVMLIFTDAPLQLRKWQIIDAQGSLTDTTLINPNFDVPLNEALFEYDGPTPSNSN
jgi:outer membrane lipoprotein-sorting protein